MPDLHVRLTSFLAGHLPWRVLRLDARLHRLVEGSLEDDPTEALEKCWNLLDGDPEAACDYIAHSYSSSLRFDVSRIYRNACALIATAKAAAAVRRLRIDPLAWDCFLESWRQAAKSLLGPLARPASGAPKVSPPPVAISSNATEVVNYACRELASTNWPLAALSHWTLNWLKAGSDDAARRRIVPVGGCHADKGFVAYLTLTLLEDSRSELVEDPGIALRPFGEDLLETLRLQRRLRTSKSVSWSLSA